MKYTLFLILFYISVTSFAQVPDSVSIQKVGISNSLKNVVSDSLAKLHKENPLKDSLYYLSISNITLKILGDRLKIVEAKRHLRDIHRITEIDSIRSKASINRQDFEKDFFKSIKIGNPDSLLPVKEQLAFDSSTYKLDSAKIESASDHLVNMGEGLIGNTKEISLLKSNDTFLGTNQLPLKDPTSNPKMIGEKTLSALKALPQQEIHKQKKKIESAHHFLNRYKKKYDELHSVNDLSSAVNKHSLKENKLVDRMGIGGNIQVISYDPFTLGLSPTASYNFNKLLQAGVTFEFNYLLNYNDKLTSKKLSESYLLFVNHLLYNNFFGYSEFGFTNLNEQNSESVQNSYRKHWQIGIGRRIVVSSHISINTIFLYNLLYDPADLVMSKRWSLKIGFEYSLNHLTNRKEE